MNANEEQVAFQLIYAGCEPEPNRFTNDLPINAEVWLAFRNVQFAAPCPLLLTPHLAAGIGELRKSLSLVLAEIPDDVVIYERTLATETVPYLSSSESHVLAHITFEQLLRILPLSSWWERTIRKPFLRSANEPGAEPTLPLPGLLTQQSET